MKKTLFTLLMLMALTISAMSQHLYIHETDEGTCRQNYRSVMTPNGDIIIDENIFVDGGSVDVGIKFLKYNTEGILTDSVFVDDMVISDLNIFVRNPLADDESVYLYVTRNENNGMYYYCAMFMNDDLGIRDKIRVPLPIEGDLHYKRYRMEEDGSVIFSWHNASNDSCRYARLNITGELLSVSEPFPIENFIPVINPWFKITEEPRRLGYLMYFPETQDSLGNKLGDIRVNVLDNELDVVDTKSIVRIGGQKTQATHQASVVELGDGSFAIMSSVINVMGPNGYRRKGVAKYNSNFEQQCYHLIKYVAALEYPLPMSVDRIDGGLYVIWYDENIYTQSIYTHVRHLNSNMEEVWDNVCIKNNGYTVVYTSKPVEEGGCVLSGQLSGCNYYDSYVFVNFIDPDYDNADEVSADNTPFHCYPNPACSVLNISFAEELECQSVEIFTLDGRMMKSQNNNFETIDISNLTAGVYILKVTMADGKEYSERIVKE